MVIREKENREVLLLYMLIHNTFLKRILRAIIRQAGLSLNNYNKIIKIVYT